MNEEISEEISQEVLPEPRNDIYHHHSGTQMTEALYSATWTAFDRHGRHVLITVRKAHGEAKEFAQALERMPDFLAEQGYTSKAGDRPVARPAARTLPDDAGFSDEELGEIGEIPPDAETDGATQPALVPHDPDFCHVHKAPMRPNTFGGQDHKTTAGFCKGNWCEEHGKSFVLREGKGDRAGQFWWSHQLESGAYCNGGDAPPAPF
jgi:hypothetical protein